MRQEYFVHFEYANYAHIFQYCLFDALTRMAEEEGLFDDFSYGFDIVNEGNIVYISTPDLTLPKFKKSDVESALKRLELKLEMRSKNENVAELTKLMNSAVIEPITSSVSIEIENDLLESLLVSFVSDKTLKKEIDMYIVSASVESDDCSEAIVASLLMRPFFAAITRRLQIRNSDVLVMSNGKEILILSEKTLEIEEFIEEAIESLRAKRFDEVCAKNRDYLLKKYKTADILSDCGVLVSEEKVREILTHADNRRALSAISINMD